MDVLTKAQRSYNMSQIRSKNTKPEVTIFTMLKKHGHSYKKHFPIPGRPDLVFPEHKVAVFIDGEFWHGKYFKATKKTLSPFWIKKIGDNIRRDRRNSRLLRLDGWHILHLWGKKVVRHPEESLNRILRFIERLKRLNVSAK